MLSDLAINSYFRLQQIILATKDYDQVFKNLLPQILLEMSSLQYKYSFLNVVSLNDKNLIKNSFLVEAATLTMTDNTFTPDLNIQILFDQTKPWEKELLWGRLLVTEDKSLLTSQNTTQFKSLIVAPLIAANKLTGLLLLASERDIKSIGGEEKELLMMISNLMSLSFKLLESQEALSNFTKQLYEMNAKLHALDKLKDDFISIASHELRTPMTAIRSYAWMALHRGDMPLSEKLKKYLERTLISTERLINLVNDMLNVSRIESGRIEILPEAFDIQNLLGEVFIEVEAKSKEKNLHLLAPKAQIPQIFADSNKVHQVLLNLIGNALKFTPPNGNITVSFMSDGKTIETAVTDSGVGINPVDLPRLFQKFSRLDSSYVAAASSGGTGLGLFICKSLIERMGGKIWVKSEGEGKGTTFTFSLPVATPDLIKEAAKYHYQPEGEARLLEPVAIQAYPNEPA